MTHPDTFAKISFLRGRVAELETDNAYLESQLANKLDNIVDGNKELLAALQESKQARQVEAWQPVRNETIQCGNTSFYVDGLGDIVFEDQIVSLPDNVAVCRLVTP